MRMSYVSTAMCPIAIHKSLAFLCMAGEVGRRVPFVFLDEVIRRASALLIPRPRGRAIPFLIQPAPLKPRFCRFPAAASRCRHSPPMAPSQRALMV